MKKVLRTFIITILLVIIGWSLYIIQEKPYLLQEVVGCNPLTSDQQDFNNQLTESINNLHTNDEKIIQMIESLTITENTNENPTLDTDVDNNNTDESKTNTNNEFNDVTQAPDQTNNN